MKFNASFDNAHVEFEMSLEEFREWLSEAKEIVNAINNGTIRNAVKELKEIVEIASPKAPEHVCNQSKAHIKKWAKSQIKDKLRKKTEKFDAKKVLKEDFGIDL